MASSDEDRESQIAHFVSVAGVDNERARFYLESADWEVGLALSSFFDQAGDDSPEIVAEIPVPVPEDKTAADKDKTTSSKFGTLAHFPHDDSSSEDEGQAFYAGGSEHSGQQILGPSKKKDKEKKNIVSDLFKAAKDHGAEVVDPSESNTKKTSAFTGSGFKLGQMDTDHVKVQPATSPHQEPKQVILRLWKNGFTVSDGPLRDFMDPANKEFLSSIQRGEIPIELTRNLRGAEVHLNMEDHREEDYVPPKQTVKVFSGKGHTLGNITPSFTSTQEPSAAAVLEYKLDVDSTQPTTNIQIRLPDGSRLVQSFNLTHTVGDIRQHIMSSRPQYAGQSFALMTTFPNKELVNDSETIKDGNLLNAAILLRLK